ncbi:cytochrome C, partial [Pseudomonas sp. GW460-11-11-14-LB11]
MAAWGFPYTSSSLSPAGGVAPILTGAFAQKSLGLTGYAWIDQALYVEGGAYNSPGAKGLARLGQDLSSPGNIHG